MRATGICSCLVVPLGQTLKGKWGYVLAFLTEGPSGKGVDLDFRLSKGTP
jgi:hypothetical protein